MTGIGYEPCNPRTSTKVMEDELNVEEIMKNRGKSWNL